MKRIFLFVFLCLSIIPTSNANSIKDSTLIFFPRNRVFPSVFLDPLECQISGGSYILSRKGNSESLYSLVNFGFTKPVVVKHGKSILWELNFGAATFTQFDLIKKDNGSYLAGLLNNDYKLSGDISVQKNKHVLRFRLFHVSSHLGDDYMLRHNDTIPNDKSDNYEQADLTYLRLISNGYWYAGIGEVYTKYVFRERLSVQGGGLWDFGKSKPVNLFTSISIKIFAENEFNPDLRTALGVSFNRKSESLVRIWLEYYSGQLPYSTLKYGRVNWLGLVIWLNLF
ncbi:MAG: DUF1207 domain-containing protein [Bacteroidales bacterium]|nr:DUF1207 domain-containing protein [Bacteroidales bacterium]